MRVDYYGRGFKEFFQKVGNWFRSAADWVNTNVIQPTKDFLVNNIGGAINYGISEAVDKIYRFFYEIESGIGYSKTFDNGKPINFYVNIPEKWWKFWEFSVGIDVNINGWGAGIGVGCEYSLTLHLKEFSFDIFVNILERVGVRFAAKDDFGDYVYTKFSFNVPEQVLVAVLIWATDGLALPAIIAALGYN